MREPKKITQGNTLASNSTDCIQLTTIPVQCSRLRHRVHFEKLSQFAMLSEKPYLIWGFMQLFFNVFSRPEDF